MSNVEIGVNSTSAVVGIGNVEKAFKSMQDRTETLTQALGKQYLKSQDLEKAYNSLQSSNKTLQNSYTTLIGVVDKLSTDNNKLSTSVSKLEKDVASLTTQLNAESATIANLKTSVKALEAENAKLIASNTTLTASITALNKKQAEGSTHSNRLKSDTSDLDALHRTFQSTVRGTAGALGKLWLSYGALVPMVVSFGAALTAIKVNQQGSNFEYITQFASSLSNASAPVSQLSVSLGEMRDRILQIEGVGKGPNELAAALLELQKSGFAAAEGLKELPTLSKYATVGEMNLKQATEQLVTIQTAFAKSSKGLNGEFLTLSDTANIVAYAAQTSTASFEDMQSALRYMTSLSSTANMSLQESAAALMILHNAGIKASMSGTSLRTAITKLMNPTGEAIKMMKDLGASISIFSKDGSEVKDLKTYGAELKRLKDTVSVEEWGKFSDTMFGQRGANINILVDAMGELNTNLADIANAAGFVDGVFTELSKTTKMAGNELAAAFEKSLIKAFDGEKATAVLKELTAIVSSATFVSGLQNAMQAVYDLGKSITELATFFTNLPTSIQLASAALALLGGQWTIVAAAIALSAKETGQAILDMKADVAEASVGLDLGGAQGKSVTRILESQSYAYGVISEKVLELTKHIEDLKEKRDSALFTSDIQNFQEAIVKAEEELAKAKKELVSANDDLGASKEAKKAAEIYVEAKAQEVNAAKAAAEAARKAAEESKKGSTSIASSGKLVDGFSDALKRLGASTSDVDKVYELLEMSGTDGLDRGFAKATAEYKKMSTELMAVGKAMVASGKISQDDLSKLSQAISEEYVAALDKAANSDEKAGAAARKHAEDIKTLDDKQKAYLNSLAESGGFAGEYAKIQKELSEAEKLTGGAAAQSATDLQVWNDALKVAEAKTKQTDEAVQSLKDSFELSIKKLGEDYGLGESSEYEKELNKLNNAIEDQISKLDKLKGTDAYDEQVAKVKALGVEIEETSSTFIKLKGDPFKGFVAGAKDAQKETKTLGEVGYETAQMIGSAMSEAFEYSIKALITDSDWENPYQDSIDSINDKIKSMQYDNLSEATDQLAWLQTEYDSTLQQAMAGSEEAFDDYMSNLDTYLEKAKETLSPEEYTELYEQTIADLNALNDEYASETEDKWAGLSDVWDKFLEEMLNSYIKWIANIAAQELLISTTTSLASALGYTGSGSSSSTATGTATNLATSAASSYIAEEYLGASSVSDYIVTQVADYAYAAIAEMSYAISGATSASVAAAASAESGVIASGQASAAIMEAYANSAMSTQGIAAAAEGTAAAAEGTAVAAEGAAVAAEGTAAAAEGTAVAAEGAAGGLSAGVGGALMAALAVIGLYQMSGEVQTVNSFGHEDMSTLDSLGLSSTMTNLTQEQVDAAAALNMELKQFGSISLDTAEGVIVASDSLEEFTTGTEFGLYTWDEATETWYKGLVDNQHVWDEMLSEMSKLAPTSEEAAKANAEYIASLYELPSVADELYTAFTLTADGATLVTDDIRAILDSAVEMGKTTSIISQETADGIDLLMYTYDESTKSWTDSSALLTDMLTEMSSLNPATSEAINSTAAYVAEMYGIPSAAEDLAKAFTDMSDGVTDLSDVTTDVSDSIIDSSNTLSDVDVTGTVLDYSSAFTSMLEEMQAINPATEEAIQATANYIAEMFGVPDLAGELAEAFIEVSSGVVDLADAALSAASDIVDATGSISGADPSSGEPVTNDGKAAGGLVTGGSGMRDDLYAGTVGNSNIVVTGGEYVMPVEETEKYYGLLEAMRGGTLGFAAGGLIPTISVSATEDDDYYDSLMDAVDTIRFAGVSDYIEEMTLLTEEYQDLISEMTEAGASAEDIALVTQAQIIAMEELAAENRENIDDLLEESKSLLGDANKSDYANAVDDINDKYTELIEELVELGATQQDLATAEMARVLELQELYEENQEAIEDALDSAKDYLMDSDSSDLEIAITDINEKYDELMEDLVELSASEEDLAVAEAARLKELQDLYEENQETIDDTLESARDIISDFGTTDFEQSVDALNESYADLYQTLIDLSATADEFWEAVNAYWYEYTELFADQVWTDIEGYLGGLQEAADEAAEALSEAESNLDDAESALQDAFDAAKESLEELYDAAVEAEDAAYEEAVTLETESYEATLESLNETLEESSEAASTFASMLDSIFGNELFSESNFLNAQAELLRRFQTGDVSGDLSGIEAATEFDTNMYANAFEYQKAVASTGIMVSALSDIASSQETSAQSSIDSLEIQHEETLETLETQHEENLATLEAQHEEDLAALDEQLNAILGIDDTVLSIEEATSAYEEMLAAYDEALAVSEAANLYLEEQTEILTDQYNALMGISDELKTLDEINGELAYLAELIEWIDWSEGVINVPSVPEEPDIDYDTYGFATGGSFEVRGPAGQDNLALPGLRVTSGEIVNVTKGNEDEDEINLVKLLLNEIQAMRQDNKSQQYAIAKYSLETSKILKRWEGDGMPDTREV